MQWTIFVLSSVLLVTARTRGERSEFFGIDPYESRNIYDNRDRQIWSPKYQKDLYTILNHLDERTESNVFKLPRKRALSVLSRWKPLGSLGVKVKTAHRIPSRAPMISMVPDMSLISAESSEGVRPLGQPLRWGRKR